MPRTAPAMPTLTTSTASIWGSRLVNLASLWSPALSGEWANLALISAAWGSSFLFVKLISASVPPFAFAAERGLISMAALLVWIVIRPPRAIPQGPREWRINWRFLGHSAVLGTTNGWAASVLVVLAVKHIDSSLVAVGQATVPLFVVLLAHFLFADERFKPMQFAGIATGFIGILFVVGPLAVFGGHGSLIGVGAMIATALCYACGTVYGRRIAVADAALLACGQQGFGALVGCGISLATEPVTIGAQSPQVWILLLVVGVLCSAVPTLLYLRMLTRTRSGVAALTAYLQPVWAALLGWVVLGEHIGAGAIFGATLVLAGVAVSTRSARPPA
jgi:drug/metabolite transporter (DMT)-like permease